MARIRCITKPLLVLAVLAGMASPQVACATIIHFKPQVTVADPVVRLADIARITDPDPNVVEQLGKIVVGPAPGPAAMRQFDFRDIRTLLRARGINLAQTEFRGASVIAVRGGPPIRTPPPARKVRPAPQPVKRPLLRSADRTRLQRRLTALITKEIAKRTSETPESFTVSLERLPSEAAWLLAIPDEAITIRSELKVSSHSEPLELAWVDPQGQPRTIRVSCRISKTPLAVFLQHDVPVGHILRSEDLQTRPFAGAGDIVRDLDQAVGKEVRRPLRGNTVLYKRDIQTVPLIRNGDIVTLYSRSGAITVSRPMRARSSGGLGETVSLVSLDGRLRLDAQVVGYHEAAIVAGPIGDSLADSKTNPQQRIRFRRLTPARSAPQAAR